MRQQIFAARDFERYCKLMCREQFLAEMNKVVPWDQLCALIEPYNPKVGNGCPPVGLEPMLRTYLLQHWFNLSGPGAEEALYESRLMCRFAGIDLGREPVLDENAILGFRHLPEQHHLGERLFQGGRICRRRACALSAAPLWMPALSVHRVPPRTRTRRAIRRCTRRARASSGTSA